MTDYDYRNFQSLFGYAAKVHERSGGVCQLCGAGAAGPDFDLWRQMTVEHLIGKSQGGYLSQILANLAGRFPGLSPAERAELAAQIDAANTVTACSFCNATTSQAQAPTSMTILIETAPDGTPEEICRQVTVGLDGILAAKRKEVEWTLASVRNAFDSRVAPGLADARLAEASEPPTTAFGGHLASGLPVYRYYEPRFSDRSHGFRPGRGCHTALSDEGLPAHLGHEVRPRGLWSPRPGEVCEFADLVDFHPGAFLGYAAARQPAYLAGVEKLTGSVPCSAEAESLTRRVTRWRGLSDHGQ